MLGRLRETLSDVTETLRREILDPPALAVDLALAAQGRQPGFGMEARPAPVALDLAAQAGPEALFAPARVGEVPLEWRASLRRESAWEDWAVGARVCREPIFRPERTARLEIPPLPRRAAVRGGSPEAFRCACRRPAEPLRTPVPRRIPAAIESPRTRQDLDFALGLPVSLVGQDPRTLPKGLWMRYTLQLVKETGHNIRTLDVLGIYWLPDKGVTEIRHDAATGRLVARLTREAARARRVPFLLARRKEDRGLVSCYLEPG